MEKSLVEHEPRLLTASQLAEMWGISVVTLWRWRKKQMEMGDPIPVVEIGGELRFDPEAVRAFVYKHTIPDPIRRHCKAAS